MGGGYVKWFYLTGKLHKKHKWGGVCSTHIIHIFMHLILWRGVWRFGVGDAFRPARALALIVSPHVPVSPVKASVARLYALAIKSSYARIEKPTGAFLKGFRYAAVASAPSDFRHGACIAPACAPLDVLPRALTLACARHTSREDS